jgi:hypothetical protein
MGERKSWGMPKNKPFFGFGKDFKRTVWQFLGKWFLGWRTKDIGFHFSLLSIASMTSGFEDNLKFVTNYGILSQITGGEIKQGKFKGMDGGR